MKKMICMACLMSMLLTMASVPAQADAGYKINEATYANKELKGTVTVPDDKDYYVRLGFYMDTGDLVIMTKKIEKDGSFKVRINIHCNYISVALVDREDAFTFGTYEIYDTLKGGAKIK